jgi:hypothetical protein
MALRANSERTHRLNKAEGGDCQAPRRARSDLRTESWFEDAQGGAMASRVLNYPLGNDTLRVLD